MAEHLWKTILDGARRAADWALGRAGLGPVERADLAEEAAQETVLDLMQRDLALPELDRRTLRRGAWRASARLLRKRRISSGRINEDPPAPGPSPLDRATAKETTRRFLTELEPGERELLQRLAASRTFASGRVNNTLMARECGVSRRTLARRLDRVGRRLTRLLEDG